MYESRFAHSPDIATQEGSVATTHMCALVKLTRSAGAVDTVDSAVLVLNNMKKFSCRSDGYPSRLALLRSHYASRVKGGVSSAAPSRSEVQPALLRVRVS